MGSGVAQGQSREELLQFAKDAESKSGLLQVLMLKNKKGKYVVWGSLTGREKGFQGIL
jgi:hypothetical protein